MLLLKLVSVKNTQKAETRFQVNTTIDTYSLVIYC